MEMRKWVDLNIDLLVEIFVRVGTESLLEYNTPFVCKSWYQASLVPNCWETLVFPKFYCCDEFVKSIVDRSQGTPSHIVFQSQCPKQGLLYISQKCPDLKKLYMWQDKQHDDPLTGDLICNWKKLEFLQIYRVKNLKQILESISIHCKNFVGLDCSYSYLLGAAVLAIVEFIPNIKHLKLKFSNLPKKYLVEILKGCKELNFLDVSNCMGFDANDAEILKLASHIRSFNCNGSTYHNSATGSFYVDSHFYLDYDG